MLKFIRSWYAMSVAVIAVALSPVIAFAQATVPTVVQTGIDDAVEMVELIGYAVLAVAISVLFFKWIRRVLR
tara:strand:+ start:49252 stop:49467 length:216 start_codon:yes stop_codon:yes gene_type:complete